MAQYILLHFRCRRGKAYSKVPSSTCTYMCAGTMQQYLNILCGKEGVTNVLVPVLERLERMLGNPDFGCMPDLDVDFDLVEVLPLGTFYSISRREFVANAIPATLHGRMTPRCFVKYHSQEEPQPTE